MFFRFFSLALCVMLAGLWYGCSSSEESVTEDPVTEMESVDTTSAQAPVEVVEVKQVEKEQSKPQQFSVQADTVDVQRKKRQGSSPSSISVKASAPKKFYTIEIGAFRLKSNVQRHQDQLAKRFKQPVRVLFDTTINLTRVCVGTFSNKSAAVDFMKTMKDQFPKDYPDCWVSHWTK